MKFRDKYQRMMQAGVVSVLTLAFVAAGPAWSGETKDRMHDKHSKHKSEMKEAHTQMQDHQMQGHQAKMQKMDPESWVFVGYDFDEDGQFEAVEYLMVSDIQRARGESMKRQDYQAKRAEAAKSYAGMHGTKVSDKHRQKAAEARQQRQQQMKQAKAEPKRDEGQAMRIKGTLANVQTFDLIGVRDEHALAWIETEDDRYAMVDLGPVKQLRDLDLEKGDRVTVIGHRGTLNDRKTIMAERVHANDQSVAVKRLSDRGLRRVKGNITELRRTSFQGIEGRHVIAKIETAQGKTVLANLGPVGKVDTLNLANDSEVRVLGRPGRINGESAVIAVQVSNQGRLVNLLEGEKDQRQRRYGSDEEPAS